MIKKDIVSMEHVKYLDSNCDICGVSEASEIPESRKYSNDQPIHVCHGCGFVYVRSRRSSDEIAKSWSDELFGSNYTAKIPAVAARQTYVAETIASTIGSENKYVCDIGSGEGLFLELLNRPEYGAKVFAIEPSAENCQLINGKGLESFNGTIEQYTASNEAKDRKFDIATIMWTLENCQDCRTMLKDAYSALNDDGHLVIATGSRILVPFKKPLNKYFSTNLSDTHSFRFSANTLRALFEVSGFDIVYINRYIDTDYLVVIGKKNNKSNLKTRFKDNYRDVLDFFYRWDKETTNYL